MVCVNTDKLIMKKAWMCDVSTIVNAITVCNAIRRMWLKYSEEQYSWQSHRCWEIFAEPVLHPKAARV